MFFKKRQSAPTLPSLPGEETINSKIAAYEKMIETAPARLREQRERELTTMPPPDDFAQRRRERAFYAQLSRGQIRNERRLRTRNTVLFVLLAAAACSVTWWIYSELVRNGIMQ